MNIEKSRLPGLAAALVLAVGLSACATTDTPPYMGGPDNFGEANRQTMMAQVIDPDPHYETAIPESSGDHAADAVERYREDKVKKPERMTTTKSMSSGGGSN
ncbi:hypothetical protein [Novosphingobium mathurense]|uniref:Beta-barrel assembly machine subunit BamF n=1 Tax=Novosphingobium mathurense TaxID=428990 RepID=A0A1U6GZB4_9SPHN|nr:hypothetical protein [Novosphingobium mathurense]SLJ88780.1 hypothetical protein SAMN06295987_101875 [Novosphingobium mathurense]